MVYVPDASRSVSVAQSLLTPETRDQYIDDIAVDYERIREQHANKKALPILPLAQARANKAKLDYAPVRPKFIGRREIKNVDLATLARYIDWGPFFQTWDLAGPFPAILTDEVVGEAATKVFEEGQALLKKIIEGRWLTANGVIALLPANSVNDDDIEVYADESREQVALTWYGLRQQGIKPLVDGVQRPNQCLADFVAPKASGVTDYIGMFAVTTGLGIEKYEKRFEDAHDDYSSIMLKSLADRLAEAFAEYLHERVRTDLWGYAPDEKLSNEAMIAEQYRGIRPAPGYPACPEHTVKGAMWDVLQPQDVGIELTESFAMSPGAAVSGFYFAHPRLQIFRGRQDRRRPGGRHERAPRHGEVQNWNRWLAPNLWCCRSRAGVARFANAVRLRPGPHRRTVAAGACPHLSRRSAVQQGPALLAGGHHRSISGSPNAGKTSSSCCLAIWLFTDRRGSSAIPQPTPHRAPNAFACGASIHDRCWPRSRLSSKIYFWAVALEPGARHQGADRRLGSVVSQASPTRSADVDFSERWASVDAPAWSKALGNGWRIRQTCTQIGRARKAT